MKKHTKPSNSPIFEELEPRLLFSADGAEALAADAVEQDFEEEPVVTADLESEAEASDVAVDQPEAVEEAEVVAPVDSQATEEVAADEDVVTEQEASAEPTDETEADTEPEQAPAGEISIVTDSTTSADEESAATALSDTEESKELVFVGENVHDYEQLVDDLQPGKDSGRSIEVVVLDDEQDGIDQVTETLQEYENLDAIHFITHGSDGQISIGSSLLDSDSLEDNSSAIQSWDDALNEDGDILLYGCNIAATEDGQDLTDTLAMLTGADVASSDDPTGQNDQGGDWDLEYESGWIETEVAITASAQDRFEAVLADKILESYTPAFADMDPYEIKSDQDWGQTFVYDSPAATYEVNKLEIVLSRLSDASSQRITVALRDSFDGALLGGSTLSSEILTTSAAWYIFDIGSVTLNDNTTYTIQVTSDGNGKVYLGVDASGTYENGDLLNKDGVIESGKDAAFKVIQAANDAPDAVDDAGALDGAEDSTSAILNATLLSNDSDLDGDTISITAIDGTALTGGVQSIAVTNGTVNVDASDNITFSADANYNGAVSFAYTISDGSLTDTATVSGTISAANDAPILVTNVALNVPEESTRTITSAYLEATDVDNTPAQIVYTLTALPSGGSVRLSGVSLGVDGTFTQDDINNDRVTYRDSDDGESTSFTFTISDGTNTSGNITFSINGAPINDAPVVTAPGAALDAIEQTELVIQGAGFSVTDVDAAAGDVLTTMAVGKGTLTIAVGDSGVTVTEGNDTDTLTFTGTITQVNALLTGTGTGTITYLNSSDTPSASTTLTVTVNDQGNTGADPGLTGDATSEEGMNSVSINITAVNDEQSLDTNLGLTLNEGATASIDNSKLSASDPDNTAAQLIYTVTTGPINGQLELTTSPDVAINSFTQDDIDNNRLAYVHDDSETTSDSFDFSVDDGAGAASTGTFSITITPVSDTTPVANADSITVAEAATATTLDGGANNVLANDTGLDDMPMTVSLVSGPIYSSAFTLNADGTFSYTHNGSENFSDSFTYRITDNDGQTNDATVSITITPINDNESTNENETNPTVDNEDENTNNTNESDDDDTIIVGPPAEEDIQNLGNDEEESDDIYDIQVADFESNQPKDQESTDDETQGEDEAVLTENPADTAPAIDISYQYGISITSEDQPAGYHTDPAGLSTHTKGSTSTAKQINEENQDGALLKAAKMAAKETLDFIAPPVSAAPIYLESPDPGIVLNNENMRTQLDVMRQEMDLAFEKSEDEHNLAFYMTSGISASLAAGAASYLLRSGSLMSSFLATVPLWKGFDPVAVLVAQRKN